ncbi:MAG: LptA/OstA family protein [Elusimicrobiota bacterium]
MKINKVVEWLSGYVVMCLSLIHLLTYSLIYCLYAGEQATITGDQMKILSKGEILEFIGNVKFTQQNLTISADKMKSNEKTSVISGTGNIYICYSSGTSVTYSWGDEAEYNKNNGQGILKKNVKVKRTLSQNTTDVIELKCEELEIFEFGDRFHAIQNVKISQSETEAFSKEAFYDHKTNEILLLGGPPKIVRTDADGVSEYSGDKIVLAVDKETVSIIGNVKTKIVR